MQKITTAINTDNTHNRVYTIRGQRGMLERELVDIYGYEVKRLNE